MKFQYKHLSSFLIIPALILLITQIFFHLDLWNFIENKAKDSLFLLRGEKPISNEIVIIAIDEDTFKSLDMQWPFPRSLYARMIRNLHLAGAKQIVFDIEFIESSFREEDEELVSVASQYDNVIFAGKLIKGVGDAYHYFQLMKPIPMIRNAGLDWGLVNIDADLDGLIRKYTLFEKYGEEKYFPIGIASLATKDRYFPQWRDSIRLEKSDNKAALSLTNRKIPVVQGNKAHIQYYGFPGTFKHYSFSSVIDDSEYFLPGIEEEGFEINEFYDLLDHGVFRDKIVLIGATVDELRDTFNTPFSGKKLMPGVEIHANFMEMVLQEDYLYNISWTLYSLILIALVLIYYFISTRLKPVIALIITVVSLILYLLLSFILFSKANLIVPVLQIPVLLIIIYAAGLVNQYLKASKEKKQIKSAFMRYMAPELVNELLKNPQKLKYGGDLQEITVLFSDIRSFTTYSEKHSPQETVSILHEYLTAMVEVIIKNKGILDKFVGDEIMALYGTPVKLENDALAACKTALEMREELNKLHKKWQSEGKDIFEIGIGINTGMAVIGNLGSEQMFDFTGIGDTINLGARLEAINKEYDTEKKIIISEFTLEKVEDSVIVKYLDEVQVKGKDEFVKIYELIAVK